MDEQKAKEPPKRAALPKKTLGKSSSAGKTLAVPRPKKAAEDRKSPEGQVLTNLLLEGVKSISY